MNEANMKRIEELLADYRRACENVVVEGDSALGRTVPIRDKAREAILALFRELSEPAQ